MGISKHENELGVDTFFGKAKTWEVSISRKNRICELETFVGPYGNNVGVLPFGTLG